MPVALVTGANRGIGRETARQLAERGYDVILSARDESRAREAAEAVGATPLELDVSDPDSIERAATAVREQPGALDVLVNNAGVGTDWGVAGAEPDFGAIQSALDTNFFGAYRLTVALLPLLRESEHPRIVNVSSGMGGIAEMGGWSPGYRVSKAALNAMTRILSAELGDSGNLEGSRHRLLAGSKSTRPARASSTPTWVVSSGPRSRWRTARRASSGWPRSRTTVPPAGSSATVSRSRSRPLGPAAARQVPATPPALLPAPPPPAAAAPAQRLRIRRP